MRGDEEGLTYFTYQPIASEQTDSTRVYEVDLVQRDEATGEIIGGETFRIIQAPRPALLPQISYTIEGGNYMLNVTNVNEDVSYQWFDEVGNTIGTKRQLSVAAKKAGGKYRLRVESKKDGAVNYATVHLNRIASIKNITPNPFTSDVKILLAETAAAPLKIKVVSVNTQHIIAEATFEEGEKETTLYTSSYPSGVYLVSLYSDNALIETQKIVKQ